MGRWTDGQMGRCVHTTLVSVRTLYGWVLNSTSPDRLPASVHIHAASFPNMLELPPPVSEAREDRYHPYCIRVPDLPLHMPTVPLSSL